MKLIKMVSALVLLLVSCGVLAVGIHDLDIRAIAAGIIGLVMGWIMLGYIMDNEF